MKASTCALVALMIAMTSRSPAIAKPRAPVVLAIESTPVAGGHDVTLVARPTRAVDSIELRLAGQRVRFGATAAGQRRVLRVRVGDGTDVVGSALVGRGRSLRSAAAVARIGTPAAPLARRTVETVREIGGLEVLEVREVAP